MVTTRLDCWLAICLGVLASGAAQGRAEGLLPASGIEPTAVTSTPEAIPLQQPAGPVQSFVDLDQYIVDGAPEEMYSLDDWQWQVLPAGLIYENYLAGVKESRLSGGFFYVDKDGWVLDATLGGRVGLLRYGDRAAVRPSGFQIDVEGSAQLRLDPDENMDLHDADFRAGLPITFGAGRRRWKVGYYHISAHTGDEYLLKNPGHQRLNFARDVLLLGQAYYLTPRTRIYAEAGWAFYSDVSKEWEFQFGLDSAPVEPTGVVGAPFWAINGHLREELNYSGSLTAQVGWAWRSDVGSPLLRAGLHYFNGKSNHYSFYQVFEQQLGMAVWYDY